MRSVTDFFKKVVKSTNEHNEVSARAMSTSVEVASAGTSSSAQLDSQQASPSYAVTGSTTTIKGLGTIDSGPAQPKLAKFPLTMFGKQNRSFSKSYYDMYQWLEYSVELDAVFCYVCRTYNTNISIADEVFTSLGLKNWKKIKEKLDKHEKCKVHLTCLEKYRMSQQTKKAGSVMAVMSSAYKLEVERNIYYLSKVVDIIIYLCTQGLALRGHDEKIDSDNRGNFLELCQLFARNDEQFKNGFERTVSFCSKMIQNEIIDIISSMTTDIIIDEIKQSGVLSIMIDEAKCYREQQLSFCIRYVDQHLVPHERFLLFKDCSNDRSADDLANMVLNTLQNLGIQHLKIVAQTYDGASVMSGKNSGLQAKIRGKYPEAIYFHCYAHKVALVVTDLCRHVESSNLLFNGLEALYVHFSRPSNHTFFKKAADLLQVKRSFEVTAQSSTRWTCRYKNCEQLISNFDIVRDALRLEIDECENTNAIEAVGILSTISRADFIVNLFVFGDMLTLTHVLSKQLQSEEVTLGGASHIIESTIKTLKDKRNGDFSLLWDKISEFSEKHDICLKPPRSSKRKKQENTRFKDSVVMSTLGMDHNPQTDDENLSEKNYWKCHVYLRVLDVVTERLEHRFNKESLEIARAVDCLFSLDFENSAKFLEAYGGVLNINPSLLKAEMSIAKNCTNKSEATPSSIKNRDEMMRKLVTKETFPNLFKCFKVAATIPISSASCERSFSAMRRIKNWLRTSMTQDRFSNLALLHIEKGILKRSVNTLSVVERFSQKPRKLHFK